MSIYTRSHEYLKKVKSNISFLNFENKVDVPGNNIHIDTIQLSRASTSKVSTTQPPTQDINTNQSTSTHQNQKTQLTPKATSPHQNQLTHTYNKSQLLKHKKNHQYQHQHNTNHNKTKLKTIKISNHTIHRYNKIKHSTKHIHNKKTFKIPTFNTKFSLRGSSLAENGLGNQPGGKGTRPGLGGDLVVENGLYQETSAPSRVANSQQQCSTVMQTPVHIQKTKHKFKYNKLTLYWKKKKTNKSNTTHTTKYNTPRATSTPTTASQNQHTMSNKPNTNKTHTSTHKNLTTTTTIITTTTTPTEKASRARLSKRKGRATNKWNSKQRKLQKTIAPEGLPSGSPGQPRLLATCGDQRPHAPP